MDYIGIDVGKENVGIAVSDGVLSKPYETVSYDDTYESIRSLTRNAVVVIGYPKSNEGVENDVMEQVIQLKDRLEKEGYRTVLIDEQYTTQSAYRMAKEKDNLLTEYGKRRKKKRAVAKDMFAAAIILQDYLDIKNDRKGCII